MQNQILFKGIEIGKLFDFPSTNSKITKEFCNKNKGEIPVYASSKNEKSVLGHIKDNLKGVKYYQDCLSWNRNGSVGYVFIRNHKFSTNEDHRSMKIKQEYKKLLDMTYLKYEIQKTLFINGFSFLDKCGVNKIKSVFINIPIDKNEKFDIDVQKYFGKKYEKLSELRNGILSDFHEINKLNVNLGIDCDKEFLSLGNENYFSIDNGERIRKEDIDKAKGNIPVYSSSKYKKETLGFVSDNIKEIVPKAKKFSGLCITINADATDYSAFIRNETFYANDVLNIIKIISKEIYPKYIVFELNNVLRNLNLAWNNKLYKGKLKTLDLEIPIKTDEKFDFDKQKEIADKYEKLEEIKNKLMQDYEEIKSLQIEILS